ncbi:MAG TPA: hypothetical protein ENG95_00845 [Nitrospirae bacterium]|nr:polyketide cyclase / dehydrase and lipid transport [bacterium BMS3Abin10]GBE38261.1 polyketide cyclase / dehydrase and lipid transport [bacterium BMS3Bbin08]HDH50390.1 hypothetical protein [Nitrospirota bacterium]HDK81057.1 hypothetical protein [Nitrospirota bacterium]HDO25174.1 hypothetical protein [Nitrospirota bacterium]
MVIEDTMLINATLEKVWDIFTDLTCWKDWSTTLTNVTYDKKRLTKGESFAFCLRPFNIPLRMKPVVKEILPREHVIWSGSKYGISARHEFIFKSHDGKVLLTSRETFAGVLVQPLVFFFPARKMRKLTISMLQELKAAAES